MRALETWYNFVGKKVFPVELPTERWRDESEHCNTVALNEVEETTCPSLSPCLLVTIASVCQGLSHSLLHIAQRVKISETQIAVSEEPDTVPARAHSSHGIPKQGKRSFLAAMGST